MNVKNILLLSIVIFPITIQLDHTYRFLIPLDDPIEYKVTPGDSQSFTYTKFYDTRLTDPYEDHRYEIDIYGSFQNFTIETGTDFKITVSNVSKNHISGTATFDNDIVIEEDQIGMFIRPMTNNLSLLADLFNGSENIEVRNNFLIEQVNESNFISQGIYYNLNRSRISIWDNSGWISYLLIRVYDAEVVYYEMEIVKKSSLFVISRSNTITGILMFFFIVIILLYLQFVSKRK